jgi:hypothetical protein
MEPDKREKAKLKDKWEPRGGWQLWRWDTLEDVLFEQLFSHAVGYGPGVYLGLLNPALSSSRGRENDNFKLFFKPNRVYGEPRRRSGLYFLQS